MTRTAPPGIPRISLAAMDSVEGRDRIAAAIAEAYSSVGFAAVVNHGIDPAIIDGAFAASREFHALPRLQKEAIAVNAHHRGYIAPESGTDRASSIEAASKPNLSESFIKLTDDMGDPADRKRPWPLIGPNQWPDVPGFRDRIGAFEKAADGLARHLLGTMAQALGIAPNALLAHFDRPTTWLRLLHYPPRPPDTPDGQPHSQAPDQFGSAPHTDFGCLTLLFQDDAGGLEVMAPDGTWISAAPEPGAILVNTGDIVPVWTGGRWRSTPHRVVNPAGRDRYSIAYFFDPDLDATIAPLAGVPGGADPAPFLFGDHVMAQLDATYDYRR